jgi:hypothetical protein
LFAPGQRPQRDVAGAAGQRLGDLRHQQQVGRSGQDEAARAAVLIHRFLDRQQDIRGPLNFIEDELGSVDERRRLPDRLIPDQHIVQGVIRPAANHFRLADERALAGLPGADGSLTPLTSLASGNVWVQPFPGTGSDDRKLTFVFNWTALLPD